MPADDQLEIYRQHRAAQEKYIYFLLAAVGAAIALAISQTQGAKLALSQVPLGIAVVLWGLSFICGCKHLAYVESTLYANAALLKVQAGEDQRTGQHPQLIAAASDGIREAIDGNSGKAQLYARLQFTLFVLGATCYIGWHVFEMWVRT
jgi:hypothetical protein